MHSKIAFQNYAFQNCITNLYFHLFSKIKIVSFFVLKCTDTIFENCPLLYATK